MKAQFLKNLLWILSNANADNETVRADFASKHMILVYHSLHLSGFAHLDQLFRVVKLSVAERERADKLVL
jgi:hypothetical protein